MAAMCLTVPVSKFKAFPDKVVLKSFANKAEKD